ncbi:MAG: transporter [Chthoniobacterales bacterium]|nr:transporter [Chthoniobacterales bacterium]
MTRAAAIPLRTVLAAMLMGAGTSLHGGTEGQRNKTGFNLFNPTPRDLLRELSTDRPDKTESPYTVDAGHFQIESDLVNFSYDAYNGDPSDTRTESWSFANTNFKVGLLNNVDLQLVVSTFNHVRVEDRTARIVNESSGFGDIITRLKINVWGNDGGTTAFGVMPFVKFPTAQDNLGNGAVEGGLILPLAISLPADFGMGVMTQFDFNRDSSGSGYHPEFINTITVSHSIVGDLGGYVEFFSSVSTEDDSEWIGTVDLGLTYGVTADIQLDAGVNIGVTRAADDINPFVGISWRF